MPFSNACFISYCHGQNDLVKTFVREFTAALQNELDALLDPKVFIDEARLQAGDRYNEVLASAICQSVCMIVIYSPKYEAHPYCLREYAGMERLEEKRLRLIPNRQRGLIIPVIFRGTANLPPQITATRQYYDFSGYSLASPSISSNSKYAEEIRKIADTIYAFYEDLKRANPDPCVGCDTFQLPREDELQPWRAGGTPAPAPFPLRETP